MHIHTDLLNTHKLSLGSSKGLFSTLLGETLVTEELGVQL